MTIMRNLWACLLVVAVGCSGGKKPPADAPPATAPAASKAASQAAGSAPAKPAPTSAAELADKYKPLSGKYKVATADATWGDTDRKRDLPVRIYAPDVKAVAGPLPLVVFSPGLGGSRSGYEYLAHCLAENGFICIVISHVGSDTFVLAKGGTQALLAALADPQNRIARPLDVSFVITQALSPQQGSSLLKGRIDADRIGVAGHSFGAYTTLAAVGQTADTPDQKARSFRDGRIKAAVAMSAQAPGALGLTRTSWDSINESVMTMTGTRDYNLLNGDATMRRYAFDHMPAGDKYHVVIAEATHFAFSDNMVDPLGREKTMQRDPRHHIWICELTVAFFEAYLNHDKSAEAWLKQRRIVMLTQKLCQLDMR